MVASPIPPGSDDELWTAAEYSAYRKITPTYARQERMKGNGPCYVKQPGGQVRYRRADVLAWVSAHTVMSTSDKSAKSPME